MAEPEHHCPSAQWGEWSLLLGVRLGGGGHTYSSGTVPGTCRHHLSGTRTVSPGPPCDLWLRQPPQSHRLSTSLPKHLELSLEPSRQGKEWCGSPRPPPPGELQGGPPPGWQQPAQGSLGFRKLRPAGQVGNHVMLNLPRNLRKMS